MHALNKLVNIKVNFVKLICNTLFEILNMFNALSAFIY